MIHFLVWYGIFFILWRIIGFFRSDARNLYEKLNKDTSIEEIIEMDKDQPDWQTLITILHIAWYMFGMATHQWALFLFLMLLHFVMPQIARQLSKEKSWHILIAFRIITIIAAIIIEYNFYHQYIELIYKP